MEPFPYYPINEFGPAMKGMVIGGLGIFHVFLAQFAIGGGMLLLYFEWLAQSGRCRSARRFVDGYFKILVLVSFVVGAVTGVGMWFVSIQVSPRTIGTMVGEFHWVWGVEWTFFCLEITAGYLFYRYGERLADWSRMWLLGIYGTASWFSLFWINGILSWQLTPGGYDPAAPNLWVGFFNPGFFPSLIFRTIVCMTIASLAACVIINVMPKWSREERTELINRTSLFLVPMAVMPVLTIWYFATMPPDSRAMVLGGSFVMLMFAGLATISSLLVGLYAIGGLWYQKMYVNGHTAGLLCMLALMATAGGEFVREGVRKPYSLRGTLYSNSIRPEEVAHLRKVGCVTGDPYPLRDPGQYPNDQLRLGAKVFRMHCSVCHTMDGANGLTHLTPAWDVEQKRMNIAKLQQTKTFMPPFAGTPEELESLVQLITWNDQGRPEEWPESHDEEVLRQIAAWLEEAGTEPGFAAE